MSANIRDTETITIGGAGLAGSLLALMLARQGFNVEVFERNPDPRVDDSVAGRSINLALSERGIHALRQVGLHHRVGKFALPMRGRMIHQPDQPPRLQPYGTVSSEVIYSVHRARLNIAMLDAAEASNRVRIHFNQSLKDIDFDNDSATFHDQVSDRSYQRQVFPLIATDGAGSVARLKLEHYVGFKADADLLDHGYQEFTTAPTGNGEHRIDPEALHIWPRGGFMMIALPNTDGSFTNTLFLANEGARESFAALDTVEDYRQFFETQFADALPLLEDFNADAMNNPVGVLGTVRSPVWIATDKVALMGDAAHAVVPFHGQGMNCAFEDCVSMIECINESQTWTQAFIRYQHARRDNANAIADMALENYIEMRSAVVDQDYQLRRRIEQHLERQFDGHFMSRYALVMFTRVPYSEVYQRGRNQSGNHSSHYPSR